MKILLVIAGILFIANQLFALTGYNPLENLGGNRLDKHVDGVHNKATKLEHYDEISNFEMENLQDEFLEHVERKKRKLPDSAAREAAYSAMQLKHGGKFDRAMTELSRKKSGQMLGNDPKYDARAQFDINVYRATANITGVNLSVPLFGALHYNAKYISILPQFLPAGVVLTSITINATGNLDFLYTRASDATTDVVTVSCAQVPYITFLDASKFNSQTIGKTRYQISDITKVIQFSQRFETYTKSLYGKHGGNSVSVGSSNDPKNYPNGARDIDQAYDTDGETALILDIAPIAAFTVTLNMFVQKYNRTNTAR